MDRPEVRKVLDGSGEQRKMKETGCEIICGAQTTLAVKGLMMMMMMIMMTLTRSASYLYAEKSESEVQSADVIFKEHRSNS